MDLEPGAAEQLDGLVAAPDIVPPLVRRQHLVVEALNPDLDLRRSQATQTENFLEVDTVGPRLQDQSDATRQRRLVAPLRRLEAFPGCLTRVRMTLAERTGERPYHLVVGVDPRLHLPGNALPGYPPRLDRLVVAASEVVHRIKAPLDEPAPVGFGIRAPGAAENDQKAGKVEKNPQKEHGVRHLGFLIKFLLLSI